MYLSNYYHIDPKILKYETSPGIVELKDTNNIFKGNVDLKADETTMKTSLTTYHEIFFNS